MDKLITEEKLSDTFPYLDDITVAGHTPTEHDQNVRAFLEVVKSRHLTLNNSKSVVGQFHEITDVTFSYIIAS